MIEVVLILVAIVVASVVSMLALCLTADLVEAVWPATRVPTETETDSSREDAP